MKTVIFNIDWGNFKKGQVLEVDLPSFNFLINSNIGVENVIQKSTNEQFGKSSGKRGRKQRNKL